jgi:L-iditol 2-dehydrogenase
MAEVFAVARENLTDTHQIDDLRPIDGALIEPLACVAKAARLARVDSTDRIAIIGLGFMGLLHALAFPTSVATDLNPGRLDWAAAQGVHAVTAFTGQFDVIFVLPGAQTAFDAAVDIAAPGARIVMFAPVPPGSHLAVPFSAYFQDLQVIHAYSAGPNDTAVALEWLREGRIRAEQVVSHFITLDELPEAYRAMKAGEILKPMVQFSR